MPRKPNQYGVKKRGEKWIARPYIPGRGHIWAGTFDAEEEAVKAAIAKIEDARRLPANKETIATFAARWMRDFPRPKKSTNAHYNYAAQRFAGEFGSRKLHDLFVPEAMEWARKRPHDVAPLRAMYSDARREGLVVENVFGGLGVSKGRGRRDIVAITEDELELLASLALDAHGEKFGAVFRSIIIFAAYTTVRPGELFGLDRSDLDLEHERGRIERQFHKRHGIQLPKNGRPRDLPYIPPAALQAIKDLPRRVPRPICPLTGGEILFPGREGQRISQPTLWSYWKPVRVAFEAVLPDARRAELRAPRPASKPTMDFYELRHFGATLMAELGVEEWVGAAMMGHEDGGTLFRKLYSHPRNRVAQERLKRAFGQNVKPLRALDGEAEATG